MSATHSFWSRTLHSIAHARTARRLGLTLLESTFVMLIITASLAGAAKIYNDYIRNDHRIQAANQMLYVSRSVNHYIEEHYAEIMMQAQAAGGGPVPVTGILAQGVPLADLTNIYSKSYEVYARRVMTPQGVPALQAVVTTQGGEKMQIDDMLHVSRLTGANAGYLDPDGQWQSPFGNLDTDVGNYGVTEPNNLVMLLPMVNAGDNDSEGLFRGAIDGRDGLNQMSADLDMNGFEIRNAHTISTDNLHVVTAQLNSAELAFGRSDRMEVERDTRAGALEAQGDVRIKGSLTTRNIYTRGSDLDTRLGSGQLGVDEGVRTTNQRGDAERAAGDLYTRDIRVAGELMMLAGGAVLPPVVTENSSCSPNGSIGRYDDPIFGNTILVCRDGRWGSNYRVSQEFRITETVGSTITSHTHRGPEYSIYLPAEDQWQMCFLTGVTVAGEDQNIYNEIRPYVKTVWRRNMEACFSPYHMVWRTYHYPACPDPDDEITVPDPNCGETFQRYECNGPLRPEPWEAHHATHEYDHARPVRVVDDINRTAANGCGAEKSLDGGWHLSSGSLAQYIDTGDAYFGEGWGHDKHIGSTMCAWRCVK